MASRSLGELLLRPTALSRTPLFHTSSTARIVAKSWSTSRSLMNSTSPRAAQPQPKPQEESTGNPQAVSDFLSSPDAADRAPRASRSEPVSQRMDDLFANKNSSESVSQGIDDLFASTNNPKFRRFSPSTRGSASAASERVFGADWSPSSGGLQRRKPLDLNEMNMPEDDFPSLFDAPSPARVPEIPESEKNYPRLDPSYGRKVDLDPARGRDLVRGIGMLSSMVARNKVRADSIKQRYHERPGLKRKRLKSERWRARFKAGFNTLTSRVTELTRKGW